MSPGSRSNPENGKFYVNQKMSCLLKQQQKQQQWQNSPLWTQRLETQSRRGPAKHKMSRMKEPWHHVTYSWDLASGPAAESCTSALGVKTLKFTRVSSSTAGSDITNFPLGFTEIPQTLVQSKMQAKNSPVSTSRPEGPSKGCCPCGNFKDNHELFLIFKKVLPR